MLFTEDCCRNQDCDLPACVHRFERRSHRHFRLSVPDVAANQSVHRPRQLHVLLQFSDRSQLIIRFDVRELCFELFHPVTVWRAGQARLLIPFRLQLQHIGRHISNRFRDPLFLVDPTGSTDFGQLGRCLRPAHILLNEMNQRNRDEHLHVVGKLENQALFENVGLLLQFDSAKYGDSV